MQLPFLEKDVCDFNCDIGILFGYLLNISGGPVDCFDQWSPSENRVTLTQTWLIVSWASSIWCNNLDREWCYDAFLYAPLKWIIVKMHNCSIKSLLIQYFYLLRLFSFLALFQRGRFLKVLIDPGIWWLWNKERTIGSEEQVEWKLKYSLQNCQKRFFTHIFLISSWKSWLSL